ncbi:hypothetical protein EYF80_051719 [Liparis tanakae]|uniref:Uncharacterized protein n=1 Tax=Liparis tanakae TaxID=230148 RepID=A0A4Z2FAE2_9TELE|nr:hypothetical protein EYF80_051719 [Liparis tanakae]
MSSSPLIAARAETRASCSVCAGPEEVRPAHRTGPSQGRLRPARLQARLQGRLRAANVRYETVSGLQRSGVNEAVESSAARFPVTHAALYESSMLTQIWVGSLPTRRSPLGASGSCISEMWTYSSESFAPKLAQQMSPGCCVFAFFGVCSSFVQLGLSCWISCDELFSFRG